MSFIQQFFTSRDNNANAETFVGQEGRLWWDPTTNQIYSSDGSTPGGIPLAGGGGGNGTPGGLNGQVQFNQAGNFGGSANLTFVPGTGTLTAVSFVGNGAGLTNITGSNVTGTVADAAHATVADSANSVAGGNVTGAVANATYAGTVTTAAQPNITSVGTLTSITSTGNISTTGNVTSNYFIGNGSLLTGIATSSYGNSNVAAYLASGTNSSNIITTANIAGGNISLTGSILQGGQITATGNITGGNLLTGANVSAFGNVTGGNIITSGTVTTVGNVVANYFVGNGSALFAIAGANVTGTVASATSATTAGTVTTAAQPNITSVGTLTSITSTGNISTTGNVTSAYILGNGSQLTGIVSSYGNSNVVANLAALGSNPISTTGNVTAGYFIGNGSTLTSVNASNISGNVANATYATTAGSTTQLVNGSYSLVLNSDGTMAVPGNLINTGSNPVGFWSTNTVTSYWRSPTGGGPGLPFQSTTSMANTGATLTFLSGIANSLSAKSWTFGFNGNLTFPDATVQSTAFTGTATTAGTVTTNAQPNITSVGTLTSITSTGNISTTGNVTGAYILGNGSQLTGIVSSYGNSNVAANLAAFGSNPISTTGNITGGNIIGTLVGNLTGTTASLGGNVTAANVVVNTRLFVANGTLTQPSIAFSGDTGQDSGFFLLTDGNIGITTNAGTRAIVSDSGLSVVGNITGANINGGANVNATTHTGATVSVTGNINAGNVTGVANVNATTHTGGTVSVTGNINGNNIVAVGTISATGATNGTAFAVGNSAVSNVALGMFPTAGIAGQYAIRDYSTVQADMYFDLGIGGTANGQFQFRSTSSYTQFAQIDRYGITLPTRPGFRVTGAGTTNNLTTTQNSTGALNGNNWAADYNQGSYLNSTTGVFTAPAAGLYQINVVGRNSGYAGGISQLAVVKNATGGTGAGGNVQCMIEWAASSSMNHVGSGTIAKLAVNDTLALKVLAGQINFDSNDNWSVAFLG